MLIMNFFESKYQIKIDILLSLSSPPPAFFRCKYVSILSTFHVTHKNHVSCHNVVLFVTEASLFSTGLCEQNS